MTDSAARILNIGRRAMEGNLRTEIVEGLQANPAQLPSLLLWDDEGLRLFNRLAQSKPYYLGSKEGEILKKHVAAIAAQIPSGAVIIELGCGDLYKTRLILSALEQQRRAVSYLALDVSAQELSTSLDALEQEFVGTALIDIRGLHGTYDDCAHWISQGASLGKNVIFLWMGNSMTNGGFDGAQAVLRDAAAACKRNGLGVQFLVSCDACQDPVRLMAAYDADAPRLREFILHGLDNANRVLGRPVFQPADWAVHAQYDAKHSMVDVSYTPIRELVLYVEDGRPPVSLQPGAKVRAITSGKWSSRQMDAVAHGAHLQVEQTWMDDDRIYGKWNDILGGWTTHADQMSSIPSLAPTDTGQVLGMPSRVIYMDGSRAPKLSEDIVTSPQPHPGTSRWPYWAHFATINACKIPMAPRSVAVLVLRLELSLRFDRRIIFDPMNMSNYVAVIEFLEPEK